jgi:hypothetical protein
MSAKGKTCGKPPLALEGGTRGVWIDPEWGPVTGTRPDLECLPIGFLTMIREGRRPPSAVSVDPSSGPGRPSLAIRAGRTLRRTEPLHRRSDPPESDPIAAPSRTESNPIPARKEPNWPGSRPRATKPTGRSASCGTNPIRSAQPAAGKRKSPGGCRLTGPAAVLNRRPRRNGPNPSPERTRGRRAQRSQSRRVVGRETNPDQAGMPPERGERVGRGSGEPRPGRRSSGSDPAGADQARTATSPCSFLKIVLYSSASLA